MLDDDLKNFNALPADVKNKISNQKIIATIEMLEKKYQLPLAGLIMRALLRQIELKDLASFLKKEKLSQLAASQLAGELKEKIFFTLKDYFFNLVPKPPARPAGGYLKKVSALNEALPNDAPLKAVQAKQPNPPTRVKGADFFFSADDEAEIRELAKKIDLAERVELPEETIEEKLKTIVARAQINFGSAELADRFEQILKTYLRGIRNKLETKLTLVKPFTNGGLSFDEESAQKIMDMADKALSSATARAGFWQKKEAIKAERDLPYDFSKLVKEKIEKTSQAGAGQKPATAWESKIKQPRPENGLGQAEIGPTIDKTKPEIKKIRTEKPWPEAGRPNLKPRPESPEMNPPAPARARPMFENFNSSQTQKVKVEDVKYVPRVMSPLDELKYLDLVNFRRLDKEPGKIVEKIKNKIDLLAEDGYGLRLEGVKFWRMSPVSRLYLEIGRLSISRNKPVDVIIEERKIAGGEFLTSEEFKAIMDLNKSLRF